MKIDKIAYNPGTLLSMEEVLLFAKLADDRKNVDSLWVPESWGREAFASLGALSQITKKVNLGTSIVGVYTRTPAAIAMASLRPSTVTGICRVSLVPSPIWPRALFPQQRAVPSFTSAQVW